MKVAGPVNEPLKENVDLNDGVDVEGDVAESEPTGAGLGCNVPESAGQRQRGKTAEQS